MKYYFKDWKLFNIYGEEVNAGAKDNQDFYEFIANDIYEDNMLRFMYVPSDENGFDGISFLKNQSDCFEYAGTGYNVKLGEDWEAGEDFDEYCVKIAFTLLDELSTLKHFKELKNKERGF